VELVAEKIKNEEKPEALQIVNRKARREVRVTTGIIANLNWNMWSYWEGYNKLRVS